MADQFEIVQPSPQIVALPVASSSDLPTPGTGSVLFCDPEDRGNAGAIKARGADGSTRELAAIDSTGVRLPASLANAGFYQSPNTTDSATGAAVNFYGQDCTGASSTGGQAWFGGGFGTSAMGAGVIYGDSLIFLRGDQTTQTLVYTTAGGWQFKAGEKLGFFGATPIAKPTVTGAKGGNAALTSLIAKLVELGIITDSTT